MDGDNVWRLVVSGAVASVPIMFSTTVLDYSLRSKYVWVTLLPVIILTNLAGGAVIIEGCVDDSYVSQAILLGLFGAILALPLAEMLKRPSIRSSIVASVAAFVYFAVVVQLINWLIAGY